MGFFFEGAESLQVFYCFKVSTYSSLQGLYRLADIYYVVALCMYDNVYHEFGITHFLIGHAR